MSIALFMQNMIFLNSSSLQDFILNTYKGKGI